MTDQHGKRPSFYRPNAPWLASGLILTLGSSFGQTFYIALFAGEIRADFGLTDGGWGSLYTVATLAAAAALVQVGRLADTQPLRRLALFIILAYAVSMLVMASAPSIWLLGLAVFGLRLCGQGMMGQIAMTAMARWFRANRGRAVAVAVMGYPLGEALLPTITVALIGVVGWRLGWVVTACVLVALVLPLLMVLMGHNRLPQGEGGADTATGIGGRHWQRREVLRHWSFWAIVPGMLAGPFIGTVVFFHQVHVAETRDWTLGAMALGYPIYAILSVSTAWTAGRLIDRIGPMRLMPIYLLPMAVAMLLVSLPGGVMLWYAMLGLQAITQGLAVTLFGTLWPTLYGTKHIGSIKALSVSMMVMATAIGPGVTGLVIDAGIVFTDQTPAMALWCVVVAVGFGVVSGRLIRAAG